MQGKPTLLVVEDETAIRTGLVDVFTFHGFEVDFAEDGASGLDKALSGRFDMILLDVMLPLRDGYDVCAAIREQDRNQPIIMLTAREAEDDRIRGLDTGADDYLTKPFSPRELLARVAAVMRRIRPALAGESIEVGDILLDPVAHKVTRRGRTLQLGPTEYRLLKFFMESPGRVFSRGQLLDGVWGTESEIELRTVDVHIRRLRKAIEIEGAKDPVRTVRSAGYSLEA